MSTMRRYSNARLYLPPNSTRMSFLRTTSPSNAEPYGTGIGTSVILILTPRVSMHFCTSFSARSKSSLPSISLKGMEMTCS
jgi:hypothetical protein